MYELLMNEIDAVNDILCELSHLSVQQSVALLARYYINTKNQTKKEARGNLGRYLESHVADYVPERWEKTVEKALAHAKSKPLRKIDDITVTESELRTIDALKTSDERRILFTLVVLAKYFDAWREEPTGWVNCRLSLLTRLSSCKPVKQSVLDALHSLYEQGLVENRRGIGDLSMKVLCLDRESPAVLTIKNIRSVGYEYLAYVGKGHYGRCRTCGAMMPQNKYHNRAECPECRSYKSTVVPFILCADCGELTKETAPNVTRCPECQRKRRMQKERERAAKNRKNTLARRSENAILEC